MDKIIDKKLYNIYQKYHLSNDDILAINEIIYPIFIHKEFQKRMKKPFYHHGSVSLGEHILEDAIVSYELAIKCRKMVNIRLTVIIAMLHDLYTVPYQNAKKVNEKYFFNKHGFRHPIEAVINAYTWYPELFDNEEEAKIIIAGIVHHMYPLPVQLFSNENYSDLDLKNCELVDKLSPTIINYLVECTKSKFFKKISWKRSKYIGGRIMSKADKKVSFHQIKDFRSMLALLTGKNKNLVEE